MFPSDLEVPQDKTMTHTESGALITYVNYIVVHVLLLFSNLKKIQTLYNVIAE